MREGEDRLTGRVGGPCDRSGLQPSDALDDWSPGAMPQAVIGRAVGASGSRMAGDATSGDGVRLWCFWKFWGARERAGKLFNFLLRGPGADVETAHAFRDAGVAQW